MSQVTRRMFSSGVAVAAATLACPSVVRAKESELRIFTWEGYAEPEWVRPFEAANGITCRITYTGSVDEMFAKIQGSNGEDFDIVSFDTGSCARYVERKLIQPLDPAQLPNRTNLLDVFAHQPSLELDGKLWGVPHAWGSMPLIYLKSAFPTPPVSWEVMWDPQYAQQVIALDDAINNTAMAAVVLGMKDPFNLSDAELDAVKNKLVELKGNLLSYFAGYDDGVSIFEQNTAKLMFSMGEPQAKSLRGRGIDVDCVIPKEGGIGWIDCQFISRGARDVALAHRWIDACLEKPVGQAMGEKVGYGNVLNDALNASLGMTYADRLTYLARPESYEKRIRVWNEVKAS